jgi:hypothetical protein
MRTLLRAFILTALICAMGQTAVAAAPDISAARDLLIRADWQAPGSLPPRFRNHCTYESFAGRPYCADHCGPDYQFYFCSPESFGCCRLGHGYCDFTGFLRCHE